VGGGRSPSGSHSHCEYFFFGRPLASSPAYEYIPGMANDHYVARTYLKHWCNPNDRERLRAYRKSGLAPFPCRPADVCHEWEGDLNPKYFADPAVLGEFRKIFEPQWNPTLARIQSGAFTVDDKFVAAGYWAHLTACTPSGRRLGVDLYGQQVRNLLPTILKDIRPPPHSVDMSTLSIEIDPDYIKAVATKHLLDGTWLFYALDWRVFVNETAVPFITSDNPSAIVPKIPRMPHAMRILPLSPRLCLTAYMDMSRAPTDREPVSTRKPGAIDWLQISSATAKQINRITVLNAEELVFSMCEDTGVETLVRKYGDFKPQLEHVYEPLPAEDGYLTGAVLTVGRSKGG
jgi:Protein of unknown function (DUF4238)